MIPIARPCLGPEEERAVAEVMASGMLAAGPKVRAFEAAFARFCGLPGDAAVACSSGTSGLLVAVQSLGLPRGAKVLTTPFSFIATANCIMAWGLEPVFIDVDPETAMITAEGVEAALDADPSIRAVIPVHLYGQPCEIHQMVEVAHARGVLVIEDCAQAHGASENGVPVGSVGDLAVFSFYATKNMTTGEGGMITGRNDELLDRCRIIVDQGARVRYQHETLGFNYRMTSIAAAIGLCQLEKLPALNDHRRRNAATLTEGLRGIPWLRVPAERDGCVHVFHQYVVQTDHRPALQEHLANCGVSTAIHYPKVIPDQPFYAADGFATVDLPVARQLTQTVLALPVHPMVSTEGIATVIDAVRSFVP
ncbi:MAG TPA: DegT/DnrJ/EryC1/StrS aminotransferase family protein [Armatimonadota bacterium]|nr:DegT/DnrJ/EryC1/StrS aminotransferase family protein [Armatimonadota bacterium]